MILILDTMFTAPSNEHNFRSAVAYITKATTQLGTKPAPFMAAFSSKGPNTITPEILKVLNAFIP